MPYVDTRWIGGTLSNFTEIKKRIAELEKYNKDVAEGGLENIQKGTSSNGQKMEKLTKYYGWFAWFKKDS